MLKLKQSLLENLAELENPGLSLAEKFALLKNLKVLLARKNLCSELAAVLARNHLPVRYAALIREIWTDRLLAEIRTIALLQYLHLRQTQEWGDLGEQRILISYCRHLLGIPAEQEVTALDVERFQAEIQKLSAPYAGFSAAQLRQADEAIKCDLIYKKTDYSREQDINQFLEFLGSECRIISGQLGIYRSVIAGQAEVQKTEGYRISTFKTELARTPASVLSIAAVVGGRHVAIRLQSCETIFANKWLNVLNISPEALAGCLANELENFGLSFKLRALAGYQAGAAAALARRQPEFLAEMLAGLKWHELGHGIVINDLLELNDSAFGEALGVLGANIIAVFKEALADWAPRHNTLQGPLRYLCALAARDRAAAQRQLHIYLSDNWFLGEQEDSSFVNHSEIMTALALKYIGAQGRADFAGLQKELDNPQGIFYYILAEYKRISAYLENLLKSGKFTAQGKKVSFAGLRKIYTAKVRKLEKEYPVRSLEFQVYFWAKILEELPELNPGLLPEMRAYLQAENAKFHRYLLREYLGLDYPSLRACLSQELKRKGFYLPTDRPDLAALLAYLRNN